MLAAAGEPGNTGTTRSSMTTDESAVSRKSRCFCIVRFTYRSGCEGSLFALTELGQAECSVIQLQIVTWSNLAQRCKSHWLKNTRRGI